MAKKREMPPNLVEESFNAGYKREEILPVSENSTPVRAGEERTQRVVSNAAMGYQIIDEKKEEIRSKRIQVVIKPSLNEKLDECVRRGIIKSKNDLFNQLAEKFVEQEL